MSEGAVQEPMPTQIRRKSAATVLLLLGALLAFGLVSELAARMEAWRSRLEQQASQQGQENLRLGRYAAALDRFQTALRYRRDDEEALLGLSQALIGVGRLDEARAYLLSLHERQPENGRADLELARIARLQNDYPVALRFYHSAISASWAPQQLWSRRRARIELTEMLLQQGERDKAYVEILALAANAEGDRPTLLRAARFFLQMGEPRRALSLYRQVLSAEAGNLQAQVGVEAAKRALHGGEGER